MKIDIEYFFDEDRPENKKGIEMKFLVKRYSEVTQEYITYLEKQVDRLELENKLLKKKINK